MEMCYDGALVMPSNYAVMSEDEMMYVDGGFTMKDGLKWLANAIIGGIVYDVFKSAAIQVGAWAAMNAAGIVAVASRAIAITLLAGIAACYGAVLVKTYKDLMAIRKKKK